MINRKICLVGIGKFGKKYFHEIINFKNLHLSCILRKNLNQLKYKSIPVKKFNYNLKLDKFDLAVIASPVESHYINAQYFLSKNIPIILEKPATRSLKEINKLILISKKNKVPVLVHHSDLYNKNFIKLSNIKRKIGKIKKLQVKINTFQKYQKGRINPFFDWLPHILAMLDTFIDIDGKYLIIKNKNKNSKINIEILLQNKDKQEAIIKFCNFSNKKQRFIKVFGNNGIIQYDGYNLNKNFLKTNKTKVFSKIKTSSIKEILKYMKKNLANGKYINELHLSKKILKCKLKIQKLNLFDKI
jgi:predicted dehydrogenase